MIPESEDSSNNDGSLSTDKSMSLVWKHEVVQALQRFIQNTGSFCDPYLEGDDDDENSTYNPTIIQVFEEIPRGNFVVTAQCQENVTAATTNDSSGPFEYLENLCSEGDTAECPELPGVGIMESACAEGYSSETHLSESSLSATSEIQETQGYVRKGADDSVKLVGEDVCPTKKDQSSFAVILSWCVLWGLALLSVLVIHPDVKCDRAWIMQLPNRAQRQLWACQRFWQGQRGTACMVESLTSDGQLQARACKTFLMDHQQGTTCYIEVIVRKFSHYQSRFQGFIDKESADQWFSRQLALMVNQIDSLKIQLTTNYHACQMYMTMQKTETGCPLEGSILSRLHSDRIWIRDSLPSLRSIFQGQLEACEDYLRSSHSRSVRDFFRYCDFKFQNYLHHFSTFGAQTLGYEMRLARKVFGLCRFQFSACPLLVLEGGSDTGCLLESVYMSLYLQYQKARHYYGALQAHFLEKIDGMYWVDTIHESICNAKPMRWPQTVCTLEQEHKTVFRDDSNIVEPQREPMTLAGHEVSIEKTIQGYKQAFEGPQESPLPFIESYLDNLEEALTEQLQIASLEDTNVMCGIEVDFTVDAHFGDPADLPAPEIYPKAQPESSFLLKALESGPGAVGPCEQVGVIVAGEVQEHTSVKGVEGVAVATTEDDQSQQKITESRQCFTRRCRARQRYLQLEQAGADAFIEAPLELVRPPHIEQRERFLEEPDPNGKSSGPRILGHFFFQERRGL